MLLYFMLVAAVLAVVVGILVGRRCSGKTMPMRLTIAAASAGATFVGCWALLIGALLSYLFEPWPLSLRQGPDTDYALGCLRKHLDVTEAAVASVYCREEWGFGGDTVYSIRFGFADADQISRIVDKRQLVPFALKDGRPRYISAPRWWPSERELAQLDLPFTRGGTEYLWVDPKSRTAFYQKARF